MTQLQIFKSLLDDAGFKYVEYRKGNYIVIDIEVCEFEFNVSDGKLIYLVNPN